MAKDKMRPDTVEADTIGSDTVEPDTVQPGPSEQILPTSSNNSSNTRSGNLAGSTAPPSNSITPLSDQQRRAMEYQHYIASQPERQLANTSSASRRAIIGNSQATTPNSMPASQLASLASLNLRMVKLGTIAHSKRSKARPQTSNANMPVPAFRETRNRAPSTRQMQPTQPTMHGLPAVNSLKSNSQSQRTAGKAPAVPIPTATQSRYTYPRKYDERADLKEQYEKVLGVTPQPTYYTTPSGCRKGGRHIVPQLVRGPGFKCVKCDRNPLDLPQSVQ